MILDLVSCEMNPSAASLKYRADSLAAAGDLPGALQVFLEAISLAPDSAVLHEAAAQIHSELDDHAASLNFAARAAEIAPEVNEVNAERLDLK